MMSFVSLLGVRLLVGGMEAAKDAIKMVLNDHERCGRYIVTPNLHHMTLLEKDSAFADAYRDAVMAVPDGWPVVMLARMAHSMQAQNIHRVTGSDLVPALLDDYERKRERLSIFILGGDKDSGQHFHNLMSKRWPHLVFAGACAPPKGFMNNDQELSIIAKTIDAVRPDLLLIGLGAPEQEVWAHRFARDRPIKIALCVGAAVDFLIGKQKRAPEWMQKGGLEWFYRLLQQPRRLGRRYGRCIVIFPLLIGRVWRDRLKKDPA